MRLSALCLLLLMLICAPSFAEKSGFPPTVAFVGTAVVFAMAAAQVFNIGSGWATPLVTIFSALIGGGTMFLGIRAALSH